MGAVRISQTAYNSGDRHHAYSYLMFRLLDSLEESGRDSRPLKDPLLVGNYVVAYTSTRRAPNERGSREWADEPCHNSQHLVKGRLPSSSPCVGDVFIRVICFISLMPDRYIRIYLHKVIFALSFTSCIWPTASGGRFRGSIGRALFSTTGLFQSILPGDTAPLAINKVSNDPSHGRCTVRPLVNATDNSWDPIRAQVSFKLLGLVPGFVGLRGTVEPVEENDDTVKVFFEPPVLSIADNLHLRIGKSI